MIPILYESDEKEFRHNGIAQLDEAYEAPVEETHNGEFELYLEYPANGRWASEIEEFRIILAKPNDRDDDHAFRIYDVDKRSDPSVIRVQAITITNDLAGNYVHPVKGEDVTPQWGLDRMKSNLEFPTHFSFVSDVTTKSSINWEQRNPINCIAGERGSLIDIFKGDVKRTNDTIYFYKRRGTDRVTTIRQDTNLDGFNMQVSTKGLKTRIIPYMNVYKEDSTEPTTIYGDIVVSDRDGDYPISVIDAVDFTDEELETKKDLDKRAKTYFTSMYPGVDKPKVKINVDMMQLWENPLYSKFKDLETIGIGDTVDVWVEEYDIDVEVKVNHLQYDSIGERVISLRAGSESTSTLGSYKSSTDKHIDYVEEYVKKGISNSVQISSNMNNKIWTGPDEPSEGMKEGDTWFEELAEGHTAIWKFDGVEWVWILDTTDHSEVKKQVDQMLDEYSDVVNDINDIVNKIDGEIEGKFTDIHSTLDSLESLTANMSLSIDEAMDKAVEGIGKAEDALNNAGDALDGLDDVSDTIVSIETNVDELEGSIKTKADKTDLDAVEGTVSEQRTLISQNTSEIEQRARKEDVNTLEGRVDSAESSISQNASDIRAKAEQSTVDILEGKVEANEAELSIQSDQISTKVSHTEMSGELDKIKEQTYKNLVLSSDQLVDFSEQEDIETSVQDFEGIFPAPEDLTFAKEYDLSRSLEGDEYYTLSLDGNINVDDELGLWLGKDYFAGYLKNGEITFKTPGIDNPIVSVEEVIEEEVIEYETKEEETEDLLTGETEVKTKGRNGILHKVYEVTTYEDGEVKREFLREEVIEEPVTEVILVGTKAGNENLIIQEEIVEGVYIHETAGIELNNSGNSATGFIDIETNQTYTFYSDKGLAPNHQYDFWITRVVYYDANKNIVVGETTREHNSPFEIKTPEQPNIKYLRLSTSNNLGDGAGSSNPETWRLEKEVGTKEPSAGNENLVDDSKSSYRSYESYNLNWVRNDTAISTEIVTTDTWVNLTLQSEIAPSLSSNDIYTVSGYITVNGSVKSNLSFRDDTINDNVTMVSYDYDSNTGFFTTTMSGADSTWMMHTGANLKSGDIFEIDKLKIELGNEVTPFVMQKQTFGLQATKSVSYDLDSIIIKSLNGKTSVKKVMLNKGGVGAVWSPASEDMTNRFEHVESEIKQTADEITETISSIDGRVTENKQTLDSMELTIQEVEDNVDGNLTKINQTIDTVDRHTSTIQTIETDLDGKATVTQFNTLEDTVDGTIRRIGDNEDNITQIEANLDGVQTIVADKADKSQVTQLGNLLNATVSDVDDNKSQISQLSTNINLRVEKDDVINQINISDESILLDAKRIHIGKSTTIDDGVITNRLIASDAQIDGAKIEDATIGSAKIANIDANQITGNITSFIQSYWNGINESLEINSSGIEALGNHQYRRTVFNSEGTNLYGSYGGSRKAGVIGYFKPHSSEATGNENYIQVREGARHYVGLTANDGYSLVLGFERTSSSNGGRGYIRSIEINGNTGVITVFGDMNFRNNTGITFHSDKSNINEEDSHLAIRSKGQLRLYNSLTSLKMTFGGSIIVHSDFDMRNNNIYNQSDRRLKANISDTDEESLEKISSLRFKNFNWKTNNKKDFGLIAQETLPVAPEIVHEGEDGMLGINNTLLNTMTTHAVQQLNNKHNDLKNYVHTQGDSFELLVEKNRKLEERIIELERKTAAFAILYEEFVKENEE